jgi:MerR family transcriptional regulator, light-induced transcriptional regulator
MTAAETMTIQEVADSLGVHYMTAYRYVRQGRLPATRLGVEWRIRPSDVDALGASARRGPARTGADREALERRMLAGDSPGAWWLLQSHLGGGLDPAGVLTQMVAPALRSIGERWASGEVSVAQEHRATSVAQRLVGHLGLQFGRRGKSRGTVVLAAPSGDLHLLPVAMAADLLRWRGFDVVELGGNAPADALGDAVARERRLLAVGVVSTVSGYEEELALSANSVRAAVPGIPIFMGGGAISSEAHARAVGADMWTGAGPDAAAVTVERIAASPDRGTDRSVA